MAQDARQRWQQRYDAALAGGKVRDADFTTLSGVEVDPVYGPADEASVEDFERIGYPGSSRSPAACTPPGTAAGPGRSGSSPASATPSRPTSATR
ncbi:hypothetical protein [Blastococcus brunescens]|uniref:Methylmalonyl-CoA mutase domain-containing protein n=1 Tax=Blastococcus brunescens TaxID=1564165 RepID=A0ABZ1B035_9ACTN|nr:hypothetical protein [Blastococcus sp. BMG 8361]WRL62674.1 hypothetical protein U6N30_22430 [Blastococcus sp. BMG 8361]